MKLYKKGVPGDDGDVCHVPHDGEMARLISELAEDEPENAADLKRYQQDATQRALRTLVKKQAVGRADASANKVRRKASAAQRKKAQPHK